MRVLGLCLAIGLMPYLAGCANYDSGKIDYRKADFMSQGTAEEFRKGHRADCWKKEPEKDDLSKDTSCNFMLPSHLSDKNFALSQPPIKVDDVYSIRLDHGLIAEFPEFKLFSNPTRPKNGEVVILVNAFEFADNKTSAADAHFIDVLEDRREGAPSLAKARVVYYSSDVEQGQDLNFSNIPISGPVKYTGRPVGIQIIVLELDKVGESTKSLLKSLAELGKTTLAPSAVNETLVTLGTSLLDGNRDDVIFEYRMVLDNADDLKDQITPTFSEGRYVYRRVQDRQDPMIWNNLRVDQNTGALFQWADPANPEQTPQQARSLKNAAPLPGEDLPRIPYTLETYFTINVINHGKNGIVAEYAYETWEETSKKIDQALEDPTSAQLDKIVKAAATTRVSVTTMKDINDTAGKVLQKWKDYSKIPNGPAGATDYLTFADYTDKDTTAEQKATCKAAWETLYATFKREAVIKQDAAFATVALVKTWKAAAGIGGGKVTLQPGENDVLLTQFVERLQYGFGAIPDAAFADRDAFTSAYLGTDLNALGTVVGGMADGKRPAMPTSCGGL